MYFFVIANTLFNLKKKEKDCTIYINCEADFKFTNFIWNFQKKSIFFFNFPGRNLVLLSTSPSDILIYVVQIIFATLKVNLVFLKNHRERRVILFSCWYSFKKILTWNLTLDCLCFLRNKEIKKERKFFGKTFLVWETNFFFNEKLLNPYMKIIEEISNSSFSL